MSLLFPQSNRPTSAEFPVLPPRSELTASNPAQGFNPAGGSAAGPKPRQESRSFQRGETVSGEQGNTASISGRGSTPVARSHASKVAAANSRQQSSAYKQAPPSKSSSRPLQKRELLMVITQLSIMLRSGVDLAEAVKSISHRSTNATIRDALGNVYANLEQGCMLSEALNAQRHRFGGVMVASVAAGEASGKLVDVLARLREMVRDELRLTSAIKSAVSYPIVLSGVTSAVLCAMIFFVLPQFSSIYEASRAPTPALTKALLGLAALARAYWWLVGAVAITGFTAFVLYVRSPRGRRAVDTALLRFPLLKNVCTALFAGRMFRLQGVLLDSGVPMLDVLKLTRQSVGNRSYESVIDAVQQSVINGDGMAQGLTGYCIPDGAFEMIATAEANGQLGNVLQTVGEFFETEGEQRLRDLVRIAEPAIIVCLGLVVGVIVLAVMLPLLDLSMAGSS